MIDPFAVRADFGGGVTGRFEEASGAALDAPGAGNAGEVTMRKGIFVNDTKFWTWYDEIKLNTLPRRTMTITRRDADGSVNAWTLNNAWPTSASDAVAAGDGQGVCVEHIVVAYELLTRA